MEIIPAIDIIDGKCVRLTEGDYQQKKIYNEDPLEVAKAFEAAGIVRLHLVDLDGAKQGSVVNWKALENIACNTSLEIDFGGGIKTRSDLEKVLLSGAAYATIGSLAVKQADEFLAWITHFGADQFLLGADVRNERISVSGWQEETAVDVFDFISGWFQHGITQVFCTDISKDGRLEGPSNELYSRVISRFPDLYFIASGGVSSVDDLHTLANLGCSGAIVGKAFYEGRISMAELAGFNSNTL